MKCDACNKEKDCYELQIHHKFPKTKINKKLYSEFIHERKNLQIVCRDCHVSHRSTKLIIWTEKEFCEAFNIKPRSKIGKQRIKKYF